MPTYEELKNELKEIAKLVAEFPESVRPQVYELLIKQFAGPTAIVSASEHQLASSALPTLEPSKPTKEKPGGSRKSSGKESYSVDRNLNLRGDGKNVPSFKDFYNEKKPRSAQEFNAVAVYYLKRVLELEVATLDHAYTCYREVPKEVKVPKAFKQSFIDTKNRGGWIEFDTDGNLLIPHRGVVFVDSDLPHPEPATKQSTAN